MRFLRENWFIKLFCLFAAILLAIVVRRQYDEVRSALDLPVSITVPQGQRVQEPAPGTQVRVYLTGPAEMVRALNPDNIKITLDASAVRAGRRVNVPVEVEIPRQYRQAVTVTWRPASFPVVVVSDANRPFPIQVRAHNQPAGWEWREMPRAYPAQATVTGTREAVDRVVAVVASFSVEGKERISEDVVLQALDAQGRDITNELRLEPPQTLVKGMQERVVLQKRVPVQPVFTLPPGLRVTAFQVTPARVTLQGPSSALSGVYLVETEPFRIPPGEPHFGREVGLVSPPGEVTVTPDRVRVQIRLQPAAPRGSGG